MCYNLIFSPTHNYLSFLLNYYDYSWPTRPSPLGRHGPGPRKHGTNPVRPGACGLVPGPCQAAGRAWAAITARMLPSRTALPPNPNPDSFAPPGSRSPRLSSPDSPLVSDLSPSHLMASPLVFPSSGERPGPGAGTSKRHGLGDPSSRSRTDHVASSSPCRPPRHLRRHRRRRTLVLRIRI